MIGKDGESESQGTVLPVQIDDDDDDDDDYTFWWYNIGIFGLKEKFGRDVLIYGRNYRQIQREGGRGGEGEEIGVDIQIWAYMLIWIN